MKHPVLCHPLVAPSAFWSLAIYSPSLWLSHVYPLFQVLTQSECSSSPTYPGNILSSPPEVREIHLLVSTLWRSRNPWDWLWVLPSHTVWPYLLNLHPARFRGIQTFISSVTSPWVLYGGWGGQVMIGGDELVCNLYKRNRFPLK